jgi:uncharacterized membrane protein YfcA
MSAEALVFIVIALGAGAIVKGATGLGLPLIATPVLAATLGLPHAVAVMVVPLVVTNAWQAWTYRGHARGLTFLPGLLATGVAGIALGTWLLTALPERALAGALVVMIAAYVGLRLARPDLTLGMGAARLMAPAVGLAAGALQGATGISGPVGVTFVHAMRLARDAHIIAVSAMFLVFALAQVPALALAGLLDWPRIMEGVVALVPIALLMPVGNRLARLLRPAVFDHLVLAILALIALQLAVTVARG